MQKYHNIVFSFKGFLHKFPRDLKLDIYNIYINNFNIHTYVFILWNFIKVKVQEKGLWLLLNDLKMIENY